MCGLRNIADPTTGVAVLSAVSSTSSASVDDVLACVVFVPSAPLLVPELAGPDAVDTVEVRSAVRDAGELLARHAPRWLAVGVDDVAAGRDAATSGRSRVPRSIPTTGGFGRFGVEVPVSLDAAHERLDAESGGRMPLSMLIAGWLREQVGAESVRPVVVAPDTEPQAAAALGRALGAEVSADPDAVGVLVVADGATALTPKAPGGPRREAAVRLQQRIDACIAKADVAALNDLDVAACAAEGVAGRAAWQVAAGIVGDRAVSAEQYYADAPFGVGYTVAAWTPGDLPERASE